MIDHGRRIAQRVQAVGTADDRHRSRTPRALFLNEDMSSLRSFLHPLSPPEYTPSWRLAQGGIRDKNREGSPDPSSSYKYMMNTHVNNKKTNRH
jgi:hypothetical protein